MAGPEIGSVHDGFRFKGGDPNQQSSWEAVQARGAQYLPSAPMQGDNRSEAAYWGQYRKQADPALQQAQAGVTAARRAEGLIARQEQQGQGTGGVYGVPVIGAALSFLDPELRELDAIQAQAARQNRQPGEGAISDFDAQQFVSMTYGRDKPIETNRALIQAQRAADDAAIQKREFQEWFFNRYRTTVGANEAWRAYAEENPIFSPASQQDGKPSLNNDRVTWREFFTGDQGLATQADRDARRSEALRTGVGETDPETGLPTYPRIAALTEGAAEIPGPEGGYGGQPGGPGSSPDTAIDYTSVPPDQLVTLLANGGWVRQGDGQPYQVAAGSVQRANTEAGDTEVAPGVYQRQNREEWTPEGAVADRRDDFGLVRGVDAFMRGAADVVSLETADEVAGFADAAIGRGNGRNFSERARNNIQVQRAIDQADGEDMPWVRRAGQAAGVVATLPRIGGALAKQAITGGFRGGVRSALQGAGIGAVSGGAASEGNLIERAPNALVGGAVGATVAPVVSAIAPAAVGGVQAVKRFAGRQIGRSMTALGVPGGEALLERATPNALTSGMERLARRLKPSEDALSQRMTDLAEQGIEPTFADLTDDAGRGALRALATRQTPARQAARDFADTRAVELQDRVSRQARRTISDDPRSPMEIRDQAAQQARRQAVPLYEEAYAQPIEVTDDLRALLQTPAGQQAMQRAQRIAANERRTINLDQPDMQTLDYVKRGLDDVLEGYRDSTTGRLALDTEGRAVQSVLNDFRGELDRINPAYASARSAFADSARLQDAADLGEKFLTMEADQFAAAVARLGPQERQIAQAAARRAVERAAGTQGAAPGVAQRLAGGREQGARNAALLDDPRAMESAMRAERDLLMNARGVSPAQGTPTSANLQDAMQMAGDVAGAARDVMTGNLPGLLGRAAARIKSRGFSDAEAEQVVMAAIDPNRTREVIDRLAKSGMTRREASRAVRSIRRAATQSSSSSMGQAAQ